MRTEIRPFQDADTASVIALWREVLPDSAPHNEPSRVIRQKRDVEQGLFYVAEVESAVVGTVMGGYDGHRGWIYLLAVSPDVRRQGVASSLLARLEAELAQRGCLKINLQVRSTNTGVIAIYEKLGYEIEQRVSMGKRLNKDELG